MARCVRAVALAWALGLPLPGQAHGWKAVSPPVTTAYYPVWTAWYVAPAVVWQPVAPLPTCLPAPAVSVTPGAAPASPTPPAQARPTPAPPSAAPVNPAPAAPARPAAPQVNESRSFFDTYTVSARVSERPEAGRCSIAFWNLTNQDLALRVDGKPQVVAKGKHVTFDLGRQFVWQVEGREPQQEQLPETETGLEIVIRR